MDLVDGWLDGWQMPDTCSGTGGQICQCYRPKIAGELYRDTLLLRRMIVAICQEPEWCNV